MIFPPINQSINLTTFIFHSRQIQLLLLCKQKHMVKSMTGFGKAESTFRGKKITTEIRSLNSKQLDISQFKIPYIYKEKEHELRTLVSNNLQRGKVDVYITIEQVEETETPMINKTVFASYYKQILEIADELKITTEHESMLQSILRLPDVLKSQSIDVQDDEWGALFECVNGAIVGINSFREQEGLSTYNDLIFRVNLIDTLLNEVPKWEQERAENVRQRLLESIGKLSQDINFDKNRFEQELIYYIEKMDINEEKVRLANHCKYFIDTMNENDQVGRKLGFIAQEMGREINTLGSKANHVQIQKVVVQMKDELEKIKEQLLNLI